MRLSQPFCVAVLSLFCTWLFFIEYLPPAKRVHLWSDIEGYHYPLLNYTHKSVWEGRLPLWDPSIYCGIPFAGNIQAGLFYPPNWLLYAANADMPKHLRGADVKGDGFRGRHGMRFTSVEILAFLHVWLAFLFTFLWLRERSLETFPAVVGGIAAACGGYLLSQIVHLGVSCGYAWMPLALWGIEQTSRRKQWRHMWKVSLASAMCLLAGYPPTWIAFLLIAFTYAIALPWRKRAVPLLVAAIVLSVVIGAVQILPTVEATKMKTPEVSFGAALPFGNGIYLSLVTPNYFDQNHTKEGPEASEVDYLYLGIPVLFGLVWLARRRWFPGAGPALAIAGACLFIAVDPTGLILRIILPLPVVPDVLRRYNLIAGLPLAGALLAASALSDFLSRSRHRAIPRWTLWLWVAGAIAWSLYLLWLWAPGGPEFSTGLPSLAYPVMMLLLFIAGLWLYRGLYLARQHAALVACLALIVLVDYKVFGTNRRFNAISSNVDGYWRGDARLGGQSLLGLDDAVYHELLSKPGYRLGLYEGPHSTDLRHYDLATLQGFDPFLTDQYKTAVEAFQPFRSNRLFNIDPLDEKMLRHFGVRWVMLRHESPMEAILLKHASFRKLPPGTSYYVVFEYLHAQPAWRFPGFVEMKTWDPERRGFQVKSETGGVFVLAEQFFPGWDVYVDGVRATNTRANDVFQSVAVGPGEHAVEFRYAPVSLYAGAVISALGLIVLLLIPVSHTFRRLRGKHEPARDPLLTVQRVLRS